MSSITITQHLDLLGYRVRDRVTRVEGVVVSVSFDLFGCIQAIVNRGFDKDGKQLESQWFDVARLEVIDAVRVMNPPTFDWTPAAIAAGEKGPAEKPSNSRL